MEIKQQESPSNEAMLRMLADSMSCSLSLNGLEYKDVHYVFRAGEAFFEERESTTEAMLEVSQEGTIVHASGETQCAMEHWEVEWASKLWEDKYGDSFSAPEHWSKMSCRKIY